MDAGGNQFHSEGASAWLSSGTDVVHVDGQIDDAVLVELSLVSALVLKGSASTCTVISFRWANPSEQQLYRFGRI